MRGLKGNSELVGIQEQLANLQQQLAVTEQHIMDLHQRLDRISEFSFLAAEDTPIPPPDLLCLVQDTTSLGEFFGAGRTCSGLIVESLYRHGVAVGDLQAILDFGCGCGRTMRHFRSLKNTKLYGTDYNPKLIDWCRDNLSFGQFGVNGAAPPLAYPDESFDLAYAFSVFTHFTEPLLLAWLNELSRVLGPGGYLALSTHDENLLEEHSDERQQVLAGKMVIVHDDKPGSNDCCAYFSVGYLEKRLPKGFGILEHIPCGANGQTFFLLRKAAH